jgi:prevent-host-death family protein
MKTVTASEANRRFSELLKEVRKGETILVTSHGEPVAELRPSQQNDVDRAAAFERLMEHLRSQPAMNRGGWTRAELYEDES